MVPLHVAFIGFGNIKRGKADAIFDRLTRFYIGHKLFKACNYDNNEYRVPKTYAWSHGERRILGAYQGYYIKMILNKSLLLTSNDSGFWFLAQQIFSASTSYATRSVGQTR
jgi:hypothetical protein